MQLCLKQFKVKMEEKEDRISIFRNRDKEDKSRTKGERKFKKSEGI